MARFRLVSRFIRPLIIFLFVAYFLLRPHPLKATSSVIWQSISQQGIKEMIAPVSQESKLSAIVGGQIVTIDGYTSPFATVYLSSSQGNLTPKATKANKNGYFLFYNILIPQNPGELWLQAQDIQKNASTPLAIPRPSAYSRHIGPLILAPTLIQTKNLLVKKTNAFAFGYGLPHAKIEINLFKQPAFFLFTKPVYAQKPLRLIVTSNNQGYFSFNLPNQITGRYRIFAGNIYQENHSPKSPILSFWIVSWWQYLFLKILNLLKNLFILICHLFKNLSFLILLETLILILLIKKNKKKRKYFS